MFRMSENNYYTLAIKVKYTLNHRFDVDAISLWEAKMKCLYSTLHGDVSICEYNLWKDVDHGEYADFEMTFEGSSYNPIKNDLLRDKSNFVYLN